jgi:hypothetical protein
VGFPSHGPEDLKFQPVDGNRQQTGMTSAGNAPVFQRSRADIPRQTNHAT